MTISVVASKCQEKKKEPSMKNSDHLLPFHLRIVIVGYHPSISFSFCTLWRRSIRCIIYTCYPISRCSRRSKKKKKTTTRKSNWRWRQSFRMQRQTHFALRKTKTVGETGNLSFPSLALGLALISVCRGRIQFSCVCVAFIFLLSSSFSWNVFASIYMLFSWINETVVVVVENPL